MSARSPFPDDVNDDYEDDFNDDDVDFDDDDDAVEVTDDTDDTDEYVEDGNDGDVEDDEADDTDDFDDEDDDYDVYDDEDTAGDDYDDYDDEDYDDDEDEDDDPASEWDAFTLDFDADDEDYADDDEDDEDEDTDPEVDPEDDLTPAQLRAALTKSNRENAARRKKFNEYREQQMGAVEEAVSTVLGDLADGLNINTGDEIDPDIIVKEVTRLVAEKETEAAKAQRDLAIYRAAVPLGANLEALADSKKFTATIDALDATSPNYGTEVAKAVEAAIAANPTYKTAPQVTRSGGDFTGGTTAPAPSDTSIDAFRKKRQARREGL